MSFNLPTGLGHGLLQDASAVSNISSHIAKLRDMTSAQRRARRNADYQWKTLSRTLPKDVVEYHENNEDAQGTPRSYIIRLEKPNDPEAVIDASESLHGHTISFGAYGINDGGLHIDGHQIDPRDVEYIASTKSCVFRTTTTSHDDLDVKVPVVGYVNFLSEKPTGSLTVGTRTFNIKLDPSASWFRVSVSANAGAVYDTAKGAVDWQTNKSQWASANWEDEKNFTFGYAIKSNGNTVQPHRYLENYFVDNTTADKPVEFKLLAKDYGNNYTSIMKDSNATGSTMKTDVTSSGEIPDSPAARTSKSTVKSVFPRQWEVRFSPYGNSFEGAYYIDSEDGDDKIVYAVKGNIILNPSANVLAMLPALTSPVADRLYLHSLFAPAATDASTDAADLDVYGLVSINAMVQDDKEPTGWRDSVARDAMKDFNKIIEYYMDSDLYDLMHPNDGSGVQLDSAVLAIAKDDNNSGENKTFYQSLQVPYLVAALSQSSMDEAKQLNGLRAQVRLRHIPAESPIYKRHSDKLYRNRYLEQKTTLQTYVDDQRDKKNEARIDELAKAMKDGIQAQSKEIEKSNPKTYKTQLDTILQDIDNLVKWAKERSLRWAIELLFFLQTSSLPTWYAQYDSPGSGASSSIGMFLKQFTGLFSILENDTVNTATGGKTFGQVFNEDMRLFQMTSVIPRMVDLDGNASDIDSAYKTCLLELYNRYKDSTDPKLLQFAMDAKTLYEKDEIRKKLWMPLPRIQRLFGAAGAWKTVASIWQKTVTTSKWYKTANLSGTIFETATGAILALTIVLPFIPGAGGFGALSDDQKKQWAMAVAGLAAGMIIKFAQGVVRWIYFYKDFVNFKDGLKCILGFEKVIDEIPQAAFRIQNGFARFFARTTKQTLVLAEDEAATGATHFSVAQKMFGRNLSELLGTICGIVLSVVSIVLTAIDLAKEHDKLLIAMDSLMIASSAIQILAIAAGWVATAITAYATAGSLALSMIPALEFVAAYGGPAAIALALVGVIIWIIWYNLQDHRSPVQKFIDDKASPARLSQPDRMRAPEYFLPISATKTASSKIGLGIRGPIFPITSFGGFANAYGMVADQNRKNVSLDTANKTVRLVDKVDYSLDTVWSMSTDQNGYSKIYTESVEWDEKDKVSKTTFWYLASDDDNSRVIIRQKPDQKDADATKSFEAHCKWEVVVEEVNIKKDSDGGSNENYVDNGTVKLKQNEKQVAAMVPMRGQGSLMPSPDLILVGDKGKIDFNASKISAIGWKFSQEPIGPYKLMYGQESWQLTTNMVGERNLPRFIPPSSASSGYTWSISPDLPDKEFELVKADTKDAGKDEGMIRQKAAVKATLMAKTTYTVSCTLNVGDGHTTTRTATVSIEVVDKKVALAALTAEFDVQYSEPVAS